MDCLPHLRLAIACHKRNDFAAAETNYRKALDFGAHPGARILLANLLLATSPSSPERRREALSLANLAVEDIESRSVDEQWKLSARYAYFLLQFGGFIQMDGEQPDVAAFGVNDLEKKKLLTDSINSLQRVTTLQPGYTVAWRNLSIALTAAGRLEDAEIAACKAIDAARLAGTSSSSSQNSDLGEGNASSKLWELLYKHGKALKRMGRSVEALSRYCEACEVSNGAPIVLYWLRIALANDARGSFGMQEGEGGEGSDDNNDGKVSKTRIVDPLMKVQGKIPDDLKQRVIETLKKYGGGNGGGDRSQSSSSSSSSFVPHEYIRKLFDGYSKKFDDHLVNSLGYATPEKLMKLILKQQVKVTRQTHHHLQKISHTPYWQRCADLGCGTGLLGVHVRPFVGYLSGSDLSGGMIAEAKHRINLVNGKPLYDELATDEIEKWLNQCEKGFDLILAADVFVYIGQLEGVFAAANDAFKRLIMNTKTKDDSTSDETVSKDAVYSTPLFAFSTESFEHHFQLDSSSSSASFSPEPFALTSTGRCVHSREYIRGLARAYGFTEEAVEQTVIRKNAGKDVVGDLYVFSFKSLS